MGKGLRAGIVVEAIVLVLAIALSVAYVQLGLYRENNGADIWLLMAWVLVAAIALFILWWRSLTREEMVRRFYVSADGVYNHEVGYASLSDVAAGGDAKAFVSYMADTLVNLTYKFDVANVPQGFKPAFIVNTRLAQIDSQAAGGVDAISQWTGNLVKVGTPGDESTYTSLATFESADELIDAIAANGVL